MEKAPTPNPLPRANGSAWERREYYCRFTPGGGCEEQSRMRGTTILLPLRGAQMGALRKVGETTFGEKLDPAGGRVGSSAELGRAFGAWETLRLDSWAAAQAGMGWAFGPTDEQDRWSRCESSMAGIPGPWWFSEHGAGKRTFQAIAAPR